MGTTGSEGTEQSFFTHNTSLVIFAMGIRLFAMDSTPYDVSSGAVWLTVNLGCKRY